MAIRLVFNRGALRTLRTQPALRRDIARRAAAVADACNAQSSGGYESGPESLNRSRASANVWTTTAPAAKDNARTNRMVRNLSSGR